MRLFDGKKECRCYGRGLPAEQALQWCPGAITQASRARLSSCPRACSRLALLQVAVIVEAVTKKAEEIAAVKSDAEHDLAEAKPALEAAVAALNSISPKAGQRLPQGCCMAAEG